MPPHPSARPRLAALTLVVAVSLLATCGDAEESPDQAATSEAPTGTDADTDTEEHLEWGYSGEAGPEAWGSLSDEYAICAEGAEQSPVDLADPEEEDAGDLAVDYQPADLSVVNNGHTVQFNSDGGGVEIDGTRYDLVQFHFHTPGEHERNGTSFPAELHLVHADADGNLAVLGVLLEEGEDASAYAPLVDALPTEVTEEPSDAGIELDAATLLPADAAYFRYHGSLTTPPCSEGVVWTVLEEPVTLGADQLEALTEVMGTNNRPVQPLGERELLLDDE